MDEKPPNLAMVQFVAKWFKELKVALGDEDDRDSLVYEIEFTQFFKPHITIPQKQIPHGWKNNRFLFVLNLAMKALRKPWYIASDVKIMHCIVNAIVENTEVSINENCDQNSADSENVEVKDCDIEIQKTQKLVSARIVIETLQIRIKLKLRI
ncbi:hypothetical protein RYX36_029067, partial [Vicia faba]